MVKRENRREKTALSPNRTPSGFGRLVASVLIRYFIVASGTYYFRPGFTRFSLPYFMSDEEADFVLDAVRFVSTYGWAFLPLYAYDANTGEWRHRKHNVGEDRQWLGHIQYTEEGMVWRRGKPIPRGALPRDFKVFINLISSPPS